MENPINDGHVENLDKKSADFKEQMVGNANFTKT